MNEVSTYQQLFDGIRAKCEREHWFGPELDNPNEIEQAIATDPNFDARYVQRIPADDPRRFGFVFPPISEELLRETEARLGFSLPPLLRELYANVANGGFGPGMGIYGVLEGFGKPGTGNYPDGDYTLAATYPLKSDLNIADASDTERHKDEASESQSKVKAFDYATYQEEEAKSVAKGWRPHMQVPYGQWLEHLLSICDYGCCIMFCVDSQERMFEESPTENNDCYNLEQLPWTLEEWLWRWVRGERLVTW